MSKQPSRAFTTAFTSAMSDTAIQAARHEVIVKRMSAAATAVIAGLVIGLTAAPAPAQAQNGNAVARSAMDVLGGVVGGAIGSRIGGGNGRKAATVAGAAAGVWAAEAMRESSNPPQRNNAVTTSGSSFGPVLAPGWGNTRVPGSVPGAAYSRTGQAQAAYSRVDSQSLLPSGTTQLSDDRMSKLVAMEGVFLATRDAYARAIFASEQAEDDAVLDAGGRGVQEKVTAARAQQRKTQGEFDAARGTFVSAVQHMGERGYDVHDFAHSYMLAQARVTANDMNHGDVVRVTRGARIVEHYDDINSVRESYGSR